MRGQSFDTLPKWQLLAGDLLQKYVMGASILDAGLRTGLVEILKLAVPADLLL